MTYKKKSLFFVAASAWTAFTAIAQTTNITLNLNLGTQTKSARVISLANMSVAPFGVATVRTDLTYLSDGKGGKLGNDQGTVSFVFSRLDSFDVSVNIPDAPNTGAYPKNFTGTISGGAGVYQGATGSMSFTVRQDNVGNTFFSGNGSITASGKTTSFTPSQQLSLTGASSGDNNNFSGTGSVSPLGNATFTFNLVGTQAGNDGVLILSFNSSDSIRLYGSFPGNGAPAPNSPMTVVGGTGVYAGATGAVTITFTQVAQGFVVTGGGPITQRAAVAPAPAITDVSTAYGPGETAQNAFIVIKGTNLVPASTPAAGVIWSNAPEFASGRMPTVLQGVGVKVNDLPAYVYFYCSAATSAVCTSDQLNVLSPLDSKTGLVRVTVSNNGVDSNPYVVPMNQAEPSFLVFNTRGYVAAVHADGSLLGPTSLYSGLSTPAKAGETIVAFAVGFGLPTTTLVQGSSTQFGPLPKLPSAQNPLGPVSPQCFIGTLPATVAAANLISPGLYQFNLVVPQNTPSGDNLVYCSYNGAGGFAAFTPAGNLLTVQ